MICAWGLDVGDRCARKSKRWEKSMAENNLHESSWSSDNEGKPKAMWKIPSNIYAADAQ